MFRINKTSSANQNINERGFSLIELAVVLLIITTIAAFALPQVMAYMRSYRLGVGAGNVATALQRARFLATSNNARVGISVVEPQQVEIQQFDPAGLTDPQSKGTIDMPQGITISSDAPKQIAFD